MRRLATRPSASEQEKRIRVARIDQSGGVKTRCKKINERVITGPTKTSVSFVNYTIIT